MTDAQEMAGKLEATERKQRACEEELAALGLDVAEGLGKIAALRCCAERRAETAAAEGDELGARRWRKVVAHADEQAERVEAGYAEQARVCAGNRFDLIVARRELDEMASTQATT